MLEINTPAPAFSLPDQNGDTHHLADYKGRWVVLFFYPKDSTPGCTTEACDFRDRKDEWEGLNTQVLGLSILDSASKKRFADRKELNYPLLADEDHAVCDAYGVWRPKKFMGKEFLGIVRTTILIDPKGKIAHVWDSVKVKGHVETVMETLRSLQS